ncbi:sulfotransferase [Micromonospora sp. B11E3]|uniref:sulfotransferase family protein n=1 Tax=Micromonospora sp. B11E3 TaxID=3153562 RepID=UPI00325D6427
MRDPLPSNPLLIGGDNRSGTTLTSVVLDSHPDLVVGPELDFTEPRDLGPYIVESCELLLRDDPRVRGTGVETADPDWYFGVQFAKQCHRFGVSFQDLRDIVGGVVADLGSDIVDFDDRCHVLHAVGEFRRRQTGLPRWGIKIQRQIHRVDDFARLFPGAHFVHVVRDGRDVAASNITGGQEWAYKTVEQAAAGWLGVVERPHTVAPPDRYLEMRYEDLVGDPRRTLQRVVAFLGVRWDDALLRHAELPHSLFDNPYNHPSAEATAQALYGAKVGRFRRELSGEQVARFEELAGHELTRLGYPLVSSDRAHTSSPA